MIVLVLFFLADTALFPSFSSFPSSSRTQLLSTPCSQSVPQFVCAALFIFSNCWFLLPPPLYQMPNFALFLSFTSCFPFVTTACFSPVADSRQFLNRQTDASVHTPYSCWKSLAIFLAFSTLLPSPKAAAVFIAVEIQKWVFCFAGALSLCHCVQWFGCFVFSCFDVGSTGAWQRQAFFLLFIVTYYV